MITHIWKDNLNLRNPQWFIPAVVFYTLVIMLLCQPAFAQPPALRVPLLTSKKTIYKIPEGKISTKVWKQQLRTDADNGIEEIVITGGYHYTSLKTITRIAHRNNIKVGILFDDSRYTYPSNDVLKKVDHIYFEITANEKIRYDKKTSTSSYDSYNYDYSEEYNYTPFEKIFSIIRIHSSHPMVSVAINTIPETIEKLPEILSILPLAKLHSVEIDGVTFYQPLSKEVLLLPVEPVQVVKPEIKTAKKMLIGLKQLLANKKQRKEQQRLAEEEAKLEKDMIAAGRIDRLKLKEVLVRRAGAKLTLKEIYSNKGEARQPKKNIYQIWVENYILSLYYLDRINRYERQNYNNL